jgi:hypothetical protein
MCRLGEAELLDLEHSVNLGPALALCRCLAGRKVWPMLELIGIIRISGHVVPIHISRHVVLTPTGMGSAKFPWSRVCVGPLAGGREEMPMAGAVAGARLDGLCSGAPA